MEEIKKEVFLFVKFGAKEHLVLLQKGNIYMNNLKYFVDLERNKQKKGQGDSYEAGHVTTNVHITIKDSETDEEKVAFKSATTVIRQDDDLKNPVFCLFAIDESNFEYIWDDGDTARVKIVFTEEQKKELFNEFGDNALIIFSGAFLSSLKKSLEEQDFYYAHDLVNYVDYSVNSKERMLNFFKRQPSLFFSKDILLKYQQEFRLVIFNKKSEEPITIKIEDMSDYSFIIPTEELLNGILQIEMDFKKANSI